MCTSVILIALFLFGHGLAQQVPDVRNILQDLTTTMPPSSPSWTNESVHAEATIEIGINGLDESRVVDLHGAGNPAVFASTGPPRSEAYIGSVVANLTSIASHGFRPIWNASGTATLPRMPTSCVATDASTDASTAPTHTSNSSLIFATHSPPGPARSSVSSTDGSIFTGSGVQWRPKLLQTLLMLTEGLQIVWALLL